MNINDFINEDDQDSKSEDSVSLDLTEIAKTAELLDNLATEDTLLDDLAKLAVLQDLTRFNNDNK